MLGRSRTPETRGSAPQPPRGPCTMTSPESEPLPALAAAEPAVQAAPATPAFAMPSPASWSRRGGGLTGANVLALQRSAGNASVSTLLSGSPRRALQRNGTTLFDPPAQKTAGDILF